MPGPQSLNVFGAAVVDLGGVLTMGLNTGPGSSKELAVSATEAGLVLEADVAVEFRGSLKVDARGCTTYTRRCGLTRVDIW